MAIKIETLRAFSAVAQSGNLADAALRLGRTQSALSMSLKQLEAHLGQRLFEGERKNRLTPLGTQVFELAQRQLLAFDATLDEIESAARAPSGLLRIVSVPSAAGLILPPAIETLGARHPGLKVDVRDMDTQLVIDSLMTGKADIGIASGQPTLNGIRVEPLFKDRFGLVCAADHPLAAPGRTLSLAEVLAAGFIGNALCRQIDEPAVHAAAEGAAINAHNTLSLIGLVRTGRWVTLLPSSVVQAMPAQLAFRPVADLGTSRTVSVLMARGSSQRAVAEDLCTILREQI